MAVTLSDRLIRSRRRAWQCCHADYIYRAITALRYGDKACYQENMRKAKYIDWAIGVMCRTPLSTDDPDTKCVTHDFACQVIQKVDPLCIACGCGVRSTSNECDIAVNYRVIAVLDTAGDLPGSPSMNDQYMLRSSPSTIQRWDGSAWVSTPVADGEVVVDNAGDLYTAYGGLFAPYWSPYTIFSMGAPDYILLDQYQWVNQNHPTRTVVIEYTTDGVTWVQVFAGFAVDGNGFQFASADPPTASRTTYTIGNCTYGPFPGEVMPEPEPAAHDIGTSHDFSHG